MVFLRFCKTMHISGLGLRGPYRWSLHAWISTPIFLRKKIQFHWQPCIGKNNKAGDLPHHRSRTVFCDRLILGHQYLMFMIINIRHKINQHKWTKQWAKDPEPKLGFCFCFCFATPFSSFCGNINVVSVSFLAGGTDLYALLLVHSNNIIWFT